MALVLYSGLIEKLRGSLGGSVFQDGPGGPIIRKKCPRVKTNTIRQQKPRRIAVQVQQAWAQLSEDQRRTWEGWGRYMMVHQRKNPGLFLNGHQNFLRVNQYRLQYDLAILTDPTFNKCDLTPVTAELRQAGPNLFIDYSRPTVAAEEFGILFVTIPLPVTWNNPRGFLKIIPYVTGNGATDMITSDYFGVFKKATTSGDTVFFKFANMDKASGRLFPLQTLKTTL